VPGALESMVRLFEERPEVEVAYGDVEEIDGAGQVRRLRRAHPFTMSDLLLQRFVLYQPAFFFRRSVFEHLGSLDEQLHLTMDYDLVLRAALHCQFAYVPRTLARYRVHSATKSSTHAAFMMDEFITVLDKFYSQPGVPEQARMLKGRAYQTARVEGGLRALVAGDRVLARTRLRAALRTNAGGLSPTFIKALLLLPDAYSRADAGRWLTSRLAVLRGRLAV